MVERRARERVAINRLALLCVDGIRGCHPCTVLNFQDGGAMLHSDTHHTAAFKFHLSLDGFKTTKRCRVIWRNGNTCGVEFLTGKSQMAWSKQFYDPITLPDGCRLLTLRDAAEYITALTKADRDAAHWQVAMESLRLAAETDSSIELARTAVMMALKARQA